MAIKAGQPIAVGIAVGIGAGVPVRLLNGLMITQFRISPFIVTLGTLEAYRGLALVISKGLPVHGIREDFALYLGDGNLLGIPVSLWVLTLCAVAHACRIAEHTSRTVCVRNREQLQCRLIMREYPSSSTWSASTPSQEHLAGLAGMIEASRLMTGQPTAGQGYELQAIAAVVIGGGSLQGGEGSVVGTLIGACIIGLLSNGSDLLGVNPYWQQVIIGL